MKDKDMNDLISTVNRRYGEGSLTTTEAAPAASIATISTGVAELDEALGVGGLPRGRVSELYGPEGAGKMTIALHAIREAQRCGDVCAFIDAGQRFDPAYAAAIGVDLKALLVSQPDCGEQGLEIAEVLARSGAVALVVIDDVASLMPKIVIDGEAHEDHLGLQARLMSQALRKLTAVAHRTGVAIVFVNQLRRAEPPFERTASSPGGNALKFYASVRIDVRAVRSEEDAALSTVTAKVVKNKCAAPFRAARFSIRWGQGVKS